jgi:glycosyltransferase involved in cell wall biosynthesis
MSEINKRGTKVNFNDRIISLSSGTLDAVSKLDQKTLKLFNKADILARLYPYQRYMSIADVLLPNSHAEASILTKKFKADPKKIRVVHNAVESTFADANKNIFIQKYGWKDFVLFVGRIDYRKNLLPLIKACKELDYELVIIGSPAGDTDTRYYDVCKKEAGKKTHFLPGMPYGSDMLKSAYAASHTIALPSWFETPGNTVMEGGLAGANVVTTAVGSCEEYFGDLALYVNPAKYEDIKSKIKQSMEQGKSLNVRKHLLKNFTWEKHAEKTLRAYKEIAR